MIHNKSIITFAYVSRHHKLEDDSLRATKSSRDVFMADLLSLELRALDVLENGAARKNGQILKTILIKLSMIKLKILGTVERKI